MYDILYLCTSNHKALMAYLKVIKLQRNYRCFASYVVSAMLVEL